MKMTVRSSILIRGRKVIVLLNKTDLEPVLTEEECREAAGSDPYRRLFSRELIGLEEKIKRFLTRKLRISTMWFPGQTSVTRRRWSRR